jgi:hypothetical protein
VEAGFAELAMRTSSKDLVFTGRLFVYAEEDLRDDDINAATTYCLSRGIKLIFRGGAYRDARNRYEKPLAFISHDSRDKATVAEPIAIGLAKMMCPVWYDEFSLRVGDSLRESIERGIKETPVAVLILSKNFFSNAGWTKAEFDSIYTKEILEHKNVMLPVWAGVTKREVYEYSPRLADRKAVSIDVGIDEVVRQLYLAIEAHRIDQQPG